MPGLPRRWGRRWGRRRDERGASAVEYGLLIAGIAAVIAVVVFTLGDNVLDDLFESTCKTVASTNTCVAD